MADAELLYYIKAMKINALDAGRETLIAELTTHFCNDPFI
jgi:hypothetical protein